MATRGRPPLPLEVHRQRGTFRPDRHGPKLGVVARPALYLSLGPDEVQDYYCAGCNGGVVIDLYTDHVWRMRHNTDTDCGGLP